MRVPIVDRRFGVVAFRLVSLVAGCSGCADVHTGPDAGRPPDPVGAYEVLLARRDGDEVVVWAGRMDATFGDATTTELARVPIYGGADTIGLWPGASRDFAIVALAEEAMWLNSEAWLVDLTTGARVAIFATVDAAFPEAGCGGSAGAWTTPLADTGSALVVCGVYGEESRVYRVDTSGAVERLGDDCTTVWPIDEAGRALFVRSDTCDSAAPRMYERVDPVGGVRETWLGVFDTSFEPSYWDPTDDALIATHWAGDRIDSVWRFTADGSGELLRDGLAEQTAFLAMSDRAEVVIADRVLDGSVPNVLRIAVHDLHSSRVRDLPLPEELCTSEGAMPETASWSGSRLLVQCGPAAWIFEEDGDRVDLAQPEGERTWFSFSPDGAVLLRQVDGSDGRHRFDLADPDTGLAFPLPAVFDALAPEAVSWRPRRYQQCGWVGC